MYDGVGDLKALILKLNATQQATLLDSIFASSRDETADIDLSGPVVRYGSCLVCPHSWSVSDWQSNTGQLVDFISMMDSWLSPW
jgi:hypothetical protein